MPEKIAKITKTKKQISELFFSNLVDSEINAESFFKNAYLDDFEIIYIPMYDAFIDFNANWSAAFGFDRVEHYTVYEKRFTGGVKVGGAADYYMEPKTKTKTVTDWKVCSGQSSGSIRMQSYAGKVHPVAGRLAEQLESAPKSISETSELEGIIESEVIGEYDWRSKNKSRIAENIKSIVMKKEKQGDRQRDWSVNYEFSSNLKLFYVPMYSANIYYNEDPKKFYATAFGDFKTDYKCELDDDLGYLEKNKTGIFWLSVAAFALISLINLWSIAFGLLYATIHWFVINSSKNEAKANYSEIIKDRINSLGFIGVESKSASYSEMKEIFWRSKRGYQFYFSILGILIASPIFGLMIGGDGSRPTARQVAQAPIEEGGWQAETSDALSPAAGAASSTGAGEVASPQASDLRADEPQEAASVMGGVGDNVYDGGKSSQPQSPKPSFNCSIRNTPMDKLICENSDLALLDVERDKLFQSALNRADAADALIGRGSALNRAALVGTQKLWRHEANLKCRDYECAQQRLLERIEFLRSYSPE